MESSNYNNAVLKDPDYMLLLGADFVHENIFQKNASVEHAKKISAIIDAEFFNDIKNKKAELYEIHEKLRKTCKLLHYLRLAIVTDFYKRENMCINNIQTLKQSRMHSTFYSSEDIKSKNYIGCIRDCIQESNISHRNKGSYSNANRIKEARKTAMPNNHLKNITMESSLNIEEKIHKRIIIGNISKWLSPDFREYNNASHKWSIYVRDSEKSDLGEFISKVRLFLHPSYKPNDVIELTSTPFYLTRHGWGEFPIRVQLHFINSSNKPVDVIHHLKLDKSFTGLQTTGNETIIDLLINVNYVPIPINHEEKNKNELVPDKDSSLLKICHFLNDHNYEKSTVIFTGCSILPLNNSKIIDNSNYFMEQNNMRINNFDNTQTKSLIISSKKNLKELITNIPTQGVVLNDQGNNSFQNFAMHNKVKLKSFNIKQSLICRSNIDTKKIFLGHICRINSNKNSKVLINSIKQAKPRTLFSILKFIVHRMPLIERAADPCYEINHPYVSKSIQVFNTYSRGKQYALERYRAISILYILRKANFHNGSCNMKEFIVWARRYCYTPLLNFLNISKSCRSIYSINLKNENEISESTSTTSEKLNEWLLHCHKKNTRIMNSNHEIDEGIDILNISSNITEFWSTYRSRKKKKYQMISIKYPKTLNALNEFVFKSAKKIGINLIDEEIIPEVSHNSASVLIAKAIECLLDELLRISFSHALDNSDLESKLVTIEVKDIRLAILRKSEFNIFTNDGLGSDD